MNKRSTKMPAMGGLLLMCRHTGLVIAIVCAALMGTSSHANTRSPAYITELIGKSQFIGSGTLRWFGLRIYNAQLWSANPDIDPGKSPGKGTALILTYFRSLRGKLIADRSKKELVQLGLSDSKTLARWHGQMQNIFPDVSDGDRLAGVIDSEGYTRFFFNGEPIGVVNDRDFGPAFFSIWLDKRTSAPELRAQLLGLNDAAKRAVDRSDQNDDSNQ